MRAKLNSRPSCSAPPHHRSSHGAMRTLQANTLSSNCATSRRPPAAARRTRRYAQGVSGDRPGTTLLPPAHRRDPGHARSRRASHHPAQPPRLFLRRHVSRLRRKVAVRKLRHLTHLPSADRRRSGPVPNRPAAAMSLLRLQKDRPQSLPRMRERTSPFSRRRIAARRTAPAGDLPPRSHRPHGPRHCPRPP